jgi:two-component system, OmpR family, sensor kinase
MRQPMSLQLRLTLLVGLLSGGMVLLFALLVEPLLQAQLLGAQDAQLRAHAEHLARTLADAERSSAVNARQPTTPLAAFDVVEHYAELIGPDGQIRARSPTLPAGGLAVDSELLAAARAGQTVVATMASSDGTPLRFLVSPIGTDTQPGSILIVAESLAPQQRMLAEVRWLLLGCGALAVVLMFGATALVTGRVLEPLTRLMREAAAVAAIGHYDERVPALPRKSEVGQFAATINTLIATVERALRQQREFLADTSHELRSPLTVVLANLNLLRRDLEPHERELSVDEATSEAQRMRRLINELLLLAQADAAQVIARAPLRLDELVTEVVAAIQRLAPDHVYQMHIELPLVVIGDEERLTQLLRNLLENAAKYTPPGTTVDVRLRQSGSIAQLIVADTGPGIAAEHLAHLWDRYYRVDEVRSRESGGTGLGLPIVKFIAEAHGGRADVSSQAGVGTTFTIELPLAPDAAEHADQSLETSRA